MLGFLIVISDLIKFFNEGRILYLPCLIVLLLEQPVFFLLQQLLSSLEFEFGTLNQQKGLLETGSSLFSLIFELRVKSIVHHEALMN